MAEGGETEAGMGSILTNAGTALKDSLVGSLRGINDIGSEVVGLVSHTVSNTVRQTGEVATTAVTVTGDVVKGTLQTTEAIGTGLIVSTANMGQGLVMGLRDVGGEVFTLSKQAVQGTVAGVAEIGTEVGTVASHTVRGIVDLGRETGSSVGTVARDAAGSTLEAASTLSHQAVNTVTGILVEVVDGVKDILGALLPRSAAPSATAPQGSSTTQGTGAESRLLPGYRAESDLE